MTALSAMLVDGPGSEMEGGLGLILTEPYTLHSTLTVGGSPGNRCEYCVHQTSRFCSVASLEQMQHSIRSLRKARLPIPPCFKSVE